MCPLPVRSRDHSGDKVPCLQELTGSRLTSSAVWGSGVEKHGDLRADLADGGGTQRGGTVTLSLNFPETQHTTSLQILTTTASGYSPRKSLVKSGTNYMKSRDGEKVMITSWDSGKSSSCTINLTARKAPPLHPLPLHQITCTTQPGTALSVLPRGKPYRRPRHPIITREFF